VRHRGTQQAASSSASAVRHPMNSNLSMARDAGYSEK
jgi:hypothetical protein